MNTFVRARCLTTGAIAPLPKKALERGFIRNWVEVDGPVPKRSKSAAFPIRASASESVYELEPSMAADELEE